MMMTHGSLTTMHYIDFKTPISPFSSVVLTGSRFIRSDNRDLKQRSVDVLDVKNSNRKLPIFPLFQCSDSTNSYSGT